ncbi:MAG: hypothetical protein GY809_04655 [Planctomycetes bacterium]|nr:hypothetical protein [Planctomycetota bacterium]
MTRLGQQSPPDTHFPFQSEAIAILEKAMSLNPRDAKARYHLANLLFDWQPEKAMALWQASIVLDSSFAMAHRNLAVACAHQKTPDALTQAIAHLEQAVSLPRQYAIHFAELDGFYEAAGTPPETRLAMMEQSQDIVIQRDDATQRLIALKVLDQKYTEAIALMADREFEIWEGGTLTVVDDWVSAHLLRGRGALDSKQYPQALDDFVLAPRIPDNLPSAGRGSGQRRAEVAYWTGLAHEALGRNDQARALRAQAVTPQEASSRPGRGRRDRANAEVYYQALIHQALGQPEEAKALFEQLVESAQSQLDKGESLNLSAPYQNQRSQRNRLAHAHCMMGLGYQGLAAPMQARKSLTRALEIQPGLLLARTAFEMLP